MLATVLAWLTSNLTEVVGFLTGLAAVLLAARRIIWNFPVGIANNVFFFVLFVHSSLYAAAGLQVVFSLLSVWGWVTWSRRPAADHRVAVGRVPRRTASMLVLAGLVGTAVVTAALAIGTDSTTELADAATTTGSIVAQIMLNRGWIESWYVWIAVDVA